MILLLHISVALTSLIAATFAYFAPSVSKLRLNYALVASTLASGTYLVITSKANLAHACVSGLAYLTCVTVALVLANRKLASIRAK